MRPTPQPGYGIGMGMGTTVYLWNIGLLITSFLPSLFAVVAPPGSANVPLAVGSICFGITVIGALAAWSAKETHRIPLNELGSPDATPVSREEYASVRAAAR
ncbi:hypothetical protein [Arthrobacter ipis]|uniref:hypothetical protein n=1 Tax=Arthrobacter ipis TaxID=2716202 RepID=UPI00168213E4|nr:hypothetical protein [Arthrobacter ipis]